MSDDPIKYMDIGEFRRLGFLQEANRRFFHPHGLALEVHVEKDGTERLGGVWDYRDDPEGVIFGRGDDEEMHDRRKKVLAVLAEYERHREARQGLFGSVIQPIKRDVPGAS